MKEMIFEWQLDEKEIKILEGKKGLNRIKREYARKVRKFMENLPASKQMFAFREACDPSFEIYWEVSQMDSKFRTKEKETE